MNADHIDVLRDALRMLIREALLCAGDLRATNDTLARRMGLVSGAQAVPDPATVRDTFAAVGAAERALTKTQAGSQKERT